MLQVFKSYAMPIAMLAGILFFQFFAQFSEIIPYLIFLMLFFTFLKIDWNKIRFRSLHFWLLAIQLFGSILVYFLLKPIHPILAQGASLCVLAPTATAAPVITKLLDGNVESLTAYSLLSNLLFILAAPLFFSFVGESDIAFISSSLLIVQKVSLLLLVPMILALVIRQLSKKLTQNIGKLSFLSFYLWVVALTIVVARTVSFIFQQEADNYKLWIYLVISSLIISIVLFTAGRRIGKHYSDTVAGGQALGQKNTILIIWMAQSYLNPIASIAAGAYVIWQNSINSIQVWLHNRNN